MVQIQLTEYSTGWDYGHNQSEQSLTIQAHAPSMVIIKCLNSGTIQLSPKIGDGGLKRAICAINDIKINYGETYNLNVNIEDIIKLECTTNDKYKNWNYWEIKNAELKPYIADSYYFAAHNKLGDCISISIGFENYAIANNIPFITVGGAKLLNDLLELFEFKHIKYTDKNDGQCLDGVFSSASWSEPWLIRFVKSFTKRTGGICPTNINIPKVKIANSQKIEDVILCQLDSRASDILPIAILNNILSQYHDYPVEVIGGPDTKKYLGDAYKYRIGNIKFIIEQLQKCKYFIGADSGIAHLAGILGIKSYIYPGLRNEFKNVKHFFDSYPNSKILELPTMHIKNPKIINLYRMDRNNCGDWWCAPKHYFDFLSDSDEVDTIKMNKNFSDSKVIILGGGGVLNEQFWVSGLKNLKSYSGIKICWGIGHNIHSLTSKLSTPNRKDIDKYLPEFDLIGIRDWGVGYEWVPCVSCMHKAFDNKYSTKNKVVVYEHKDYPLYLPWPTLKNNISDISAAIEFIASGSIIITNTYHGWYWATLLNKRVILISPFSSKFTRLKYQPIICSKQEINNVLDLTNSYSDALEECRYINNDFARRVKKIIKFNL